MWRGAACSLTVSLLFDHVCFSPVKAGFDRGCSPASYSTFMPLEIFVGVFRLRRLTQAAGPGGHFSWKTGNPILNSCFLLASCY